MKSTPLKVLFLCTGNSARSILGEYLLGHFGGGRFETVSAGAEPTGRVNPLALRVLAEDYGIDASAATSQSMEDYLAAGIDLVVTVCDHARDTCPFFPGGALQVHWGSEDPAAFEGPEGEAMEVFRQVAREIECRVRLFCDLASGDRELPEMMAELREIGEATPPLSPSGGTS